MKAYKLCSLRSDGLIYPLFINKSIPMAFDVWLESECYPTKGFAVRQGWHCCFTPRAPHLKLELKSGLPRVWVECEVEDYSVYNRPESQGGSWILANRIKFVRMLSSDDVERLR